MPEETADKPKPERWVRPVFHNPAPFEDNEIPVAYSAPALGGAGVAAADASATDLAPLLSPERQESDLRGDGLVDGAG
jgi:hypothetical protein